MKKLLIFALVIITHQAFSQAQPQKVGHGKITGILRDSVSTQPVEFANVALIDPSLILQPLVENAIRHGIEAQLRPGRITVTAAKDQSALDIVVADNGVGLPSGGLKREGIGLSNTRARLRELHQDEFQFSVENNPTGGCRIHIRIPATT